MKEVTPDYVIWLHGGLGNQLFQWAMVTALALRHGGRAWGDRSYLREDTLRRYALDQFQIELPEPDEQTVERIIGRPRYMDTPGDRRHPLVRKLSNFHQSLLPWYARRRVLEPEMFFEPRLAARRTSVYLDGFWQDERYFADQVVHIRDRLKLRDEPPPAWHQWHKRIAAHPAIGVHVRRGDYVTNDFVARNFGVCGEGYYRRGVDLLRAGAGGAAVFVFTDEPSWAREKFGPLGWEVVSGGPWCDAAEMLLLARCRWFVLSNSSFSWWAAWLADVPGQDVIVPEPWFTDPARAAVHPAPARWRRLAREGN